jgi:hypothetical protein
MKLYYDDPLIAAYMAREFGVNYNIYRRVKGEWIKVPLHIKDAKRATKTYVSNLILKSKRKKHFIHTDSIGIFEPQVGDLITDKHDFKLNKSDYESPSKFLIEKSNELFNLTCLSQFILTEDNYDCAWSDYHWEGQEIIQRNGKNFFMPRREV